ncbi:MAG: RlmE family RNA methyltransferase [Proteobacteria bacterium]|nr:RlmE family RNA methyltransferase [Pseudomonadota bacterium]
MQQSARVLRRGDRVVDLGCWPGGWLQVASEVVGPRGRVVGVDKAPIEPDLELANVVALLGDLEDPEVAQSIREALGGPAQVVLSDAAPKLTGIRDADRAAEERLLEAIERLFRALLRPGGQLLVKLLEGPEAAALAKRWRRSFREGRTLKPKASRKGSSERYWLGRGYLGTSESS